MVDEGETAEGAALTQCYSWQNNARGSDDDMFTDMHRCTRNILVFVRNHWVGHRLTGVIVANTVDADSGRDIRIILDVDTGISAIERTICRYMNITADLNVTAKDAEIIDADIVTDHNVVCPIYAGLMAD